MPGRWSIAEWRFPLNLDKSATMWTHALRLWHGTTPTVLRTPGEDIFEELSLRAERTSVVLKYWTHIKLLKKTRKYLVSVCSILLHDIVRDIGGCRCSITAVFRMLVIFVGSNRLSTWRPNKELQDLEMCHSMSGCAFIGCVPQDRDSCQYQNRNLSKFISYKTDLN